MEMEQVRKLAEQAKDEIENIVWSFEEQTGLRLHLYRGKYKLENEVDVEWKGTV